MLLGTLALVGAVYVFAFGVPNFENIDEQRVFCAQNGGHPLEPSRETYNQMLCTFFLNDSTYVDYVVHQIENEDWAKAMGKNIGDYCFTCWDSRSCASPHNDELRSKGLHC